jgi:hypothetical protein
VELRLRVNVTLAGLLSADRAAPLISSLFPKDHH